MFSFFIFYVSVDYYNNSSLITYIKMNVGEAADLTVKYFVWQNKMYNDCCATPTLFVAVVMSAVQVVASLVKPVFAATVF